MSKKKIDEALGKEITEAYLANPKQSVKKIWEKLGKPRGISYEKVLQFVNNIMHQGLEKERVRQLQDALWKSGLPKTMYIDNGSEFRSKWEREYKGHFVPEREKE